MIMWPEIIIIAIELLYWDLYQIDLQIWDKKWFERIFIRQWDLLKKLSEANIKAETIKDLRENIVECEEQIKSKSREKWCWFCKDDWWVMNKEELEAYKVELEKKVDDILFPKK